MLFSELNVGEFFYHVNKDQLLFKTEYIAETGHEGENDLRNAVVIRGSFMGSLTFLEEDWEVEPIAYTRKDIVAGVFNNYGDFNM